MSHEDAYAEDKATIARELTEAQSLEFGAYAGYLADYGIRLRELSRQYPDPELAYQHLLKYSDNFLEEVNE